MIKKVNGKEVLYPFRSLTNYKGMHYKTAKSKGVLTEFEKAGTLTQARKILFGYKTGHRKGA